MHVKLTQDKMSCRQNGTGTIMRLSTILSISEDGCQGMAGL